MAAIVSARIDDRSSARVLLVGGFDDARIARKNLSPSRLRDTFLAANYLEIPRKSTGAGDKSRIIPRVRRTYQPDDYYDRGYETLYCTT